MLRHRHRHRCLMLTLAPRRRRPAMTAVTQFEMPRRRLLVIPVDDSPKLTRISADPTDHAWCADTRNIEIYLNGERQHYIVTADTIEGFIYGYDLDGDGKPQKGVGGHERKMKTAFGEVEIRQLSAAGQKHPPQ